MVNFMENIDEHAKIEFRMYLLKDVTIIEKNLLQKYSLFLIIIYKFYNQISLTQFQFNFG